MTKKIKIIDILCYISISEYYKLPKRIRYRYGYLYKDFTFDGESLNYISDKDILFGEDITAMLNHEVEILDEEDEFEDIVEYGEPVLLELQYEDIKLRDLQSYMYLLAKDQNTLIKNQKKIIERLKDE